MTHQKCRRIANEDDDFGGMEEGFEVRLEGEGDRKSENWIKATVFGVLPFSVSVSAWFGFINYSALLHSFAVLPLKG